METKLLGNLSRVSSNPKVTAVQCIDSDGLCIASHGTVNDQTAGVLSSIYKHAAGIEESSESPVLIIEFESKSSILCEVYGVLTVVHKNQ
uniref:Late endosomal/lysosomal adaptor and MAPK and MTOR activator 5 n=1 Tax=Schistosoma mansoni TaxID=6183 RepID=A0A3Q0KVC2_SCHMA